MPTLHPTTLKKISTSLLILFLSVTVFGYRQSIQGVKAEEAVEYIVYLPFSMKNSPTYPVFGAQVSPPKVTAVDELLVASKVYWLRINAFNWDEIEPVQSDPPVYDWSSVRESQLKGAAENGLEIIATIRFAPPWALKDPSSKRCSPIAESAFDDFAQFLTALVERYGAPPYNIKYWELGNEPDVDPDLISPNNAFGCWGDQDEDDYGGGYYADMLEIAYPAIRSADPDARVLIGGLLMDCDPTVDDGCKSGNFFEGILSHNGADDGGNYFDVVSYHGYTPYSAASFERALFYDENHPAWVGRGGVVLGKLDFLKEVMGKYGVNKPALLTEAGLICYECAPPPPRFFDEQADYVVWLYVRSWAAKLYGTTWYTFDGPGWRNSGLLDENQQPRKSYTALAFLTQMLGDSYYAGQATQFSGVEGHKFLEGTKKIWVLWSQDGLDHSIQVPTGVIAVYNRAGTNITPSSGTELIVNKPVYLEFSP